MTCTPAAPAGNLSFTLKQPLSANMWAWSRLRPAGLVMDSTAPIPIFETRLAMHRIDAPTLSLLAEIWPLLAPHLERTIDEVVVAIRTLPDRAEAVGEHGETIKKLEVAHFQALLGGKLNRSYAELCRRT